MGQFRAATPPGNIKTTKFKIPLLVVKPYPRKMKILAVIFTVFVLFFLVEGEAEARFGPFFSPGYEVHHLNRRSGYSGYGGYGHHGYGHHGYGHHGYGHHYGGHRAWLRPQLWVSEWVISRIWWKLQWISWKINCFYNTGSCAIFHTFSAIS